MEHENEHCCIEVLWAYEPSTDDGHRLRFPLRRRGLSCSTPTAASLRRGSDSVPGAGHHTGWWRTGAAGGTARDTAACDQLAHGSSRAECRRASSGSAACTRRGAPPNHNGGRPAAACRPGRGHSGSSRSGLRLDAGVLVLDRTMDLGLWLLGAAATTPCGLGCAALGPPSSRVAGQAGTLALRDGVRGSAASLEHGNNSQRPPVRDRVCQRKLTPSAAVRNQLVNTHSPRVRTQHGERSLRVAVRHGPPASLRNETLIEGTNCLTIRGR